MESSRISRLQPVTSPSSCSRDTFLTSIFLDILKMQQISKFFLPIPILVAKVSISEELVSLHSFKLPTVCRTQLINYVEILSTTHAYFLHRLHGRQQQYSDLLMSSRIMPKVSAMQARLKMIPPHCTVK